MKPKIAVKLSASFFAILLLFSLLVGFVFTTLFRNQVIELNKEELLSRAEAMAKVLTTNTMNMPAGSGHGQSSSIRTGMYGSYLKFFNELSRANVWVVDEDLQVITNLTAQDQRVIYADLPADADTVVKEVFLGKSTFSEGFSSLLDTPTLTVGVPIKSEQVVIGALLLHTPIKGVNESIAQGFRILLISIFIAMLLAIGLSVFLAITLTKPLKQMQNTALQLAQGEYDVKTGIKSNDEIGELAESIDILSQRLHEASLESQKLDQLRKDFVANISHELRTPVTVIRGSLEALCDEVVTEPALVREYYQQMLSESLFLQRLVNDLLDLSKLQNVDFKIETEEVNLPEILQDIMRSSRPLAKQKEIQVELNIDRDLFVISGDYGRLRQMFLIILDNAMKFSPREGKVEIMLRENRVTISDQGPGIHPQDLPFIFERFYRVKSEENKTGTGLGLAIARQIAERHNVSIEVESEIEKGTKFHFVF
jgi:signal transduction histidine kinase